MIRSFWRKIPLTLCFVLLFATSAYALEANEYRQFAGIGWMQKIITVGAVLIGIGALITLITCIHGLIAGEKASDNPWGSKSLEWTHTPTPPCPGNFGGKTIKLSEDWEPYAYGK